MTTLRALIAAGLVVGVFGWAVAKLPPPPPMDDAAKAAAEEKKANAHARARLAPAKQRTHATDNGGGSDLDPE